MKKFSWKSRARSIKRDRCMLITVIIFSLNWPIELTKPKREELCNSIINCFLCLQEGSIGHQLVIRPVPLDVSTTDDGSAHHVVFKRSNDHEMDERLSDFAYMEPDRMQKRYRRSTDDDEIEERSRSKRAIPHIIYPEILVIVDYDGYRLHGGDNVQVDN